MSSLIDAMKAKLSGLEEKLNQHFESDPRVGHGGTPYITDNVKGKMMKRVSDRHDERTRSLIAQINAQKEKIERVEYRISRNSTQTKKSVARISKHPIHGGLFLLENAGKVKQWARNPDYFFIVGLEKVALKTFDNLQICRCSRFPTKDDHEKQIADALIKEAYELATT